MSLVISPPITYQYHNNQEDNDEVYSEIEDDKSIAQSINSRANNIPVKKQVSDVGKKNQASFGSSKQASIAPNKVADKEEIDDDYEDDWGDGDNE